ncbi:Uncharacterized membrane protein [Clostridium amylolyticum]|uniref:Uncharacterized membrane protein n=1 Tax=Clostridium amylolyticum TaxID=1121298 RepID=A0A1M6J7M0_9CLOT|nr:DUF5808 domain-containing protein [Clostridium amylolyticum]SHJ42645.1 Uncharacterized membrane protein [Clostridium amylolyticum]
MVSIIFLSTIIIFAIALLATNESASKANNNIILGVTLPYGHLDDILVKNIVAKYKKLSRLLILIFVVISIPTLLIKNYTSFYMAYTFICIAALLYFNHKLYIKYFKELFTLKKNNNWFLGTKRIVSVDTKVSRIKNKMPVSKFYFIPSFIISFIPILMVITSKKYFNASSIFVSLIPLLLIVPFLYLYKSYSSKRSVVYSQNTEINLYCNYLHKRLWSRCWIIIASITAITNVLTVLYTLNIYSNTILFIINIALYTIVSLFLIISTHKKIREEQNTLSIASENPIYTDDDDYWEKGYYYNPNDTRVSVEKRIGYGFTFNMANKKAKLMTFIIYGLTISLVLFLSIMFIIFDTSEFKLTIDGDTAKISAPVYGYSFNINDVKEVKKIDTLPRGPRTNGASTDRYNLGNYNLNNYGKSKMYVYNENPPFIVIKLDNMYVFLNGKTKDATERYYNMLLERIK